MSASDFQYEIEYDDFDEQVRRGDPNPLCGLRIVVNGEDLAGAPAGEFYIDDYLYFHFRKVLLALPDVIDGNREEVQFYNISDYLVFHPTDSDVFIDLQTPQQIEEGTTLRNEAEAVSKDVLVTGYLTAAEGFCDRVVNTTPALADSEEIAELTEALESLREYTSQSSEND